jgi:hypothetical protein
LTKIRLTQPAGGGNAGDELDTTFGAAARLIEMGYANLIAEPEPKRERLAKVTSNARRPSSGAVDAAKPLRN